jgi:ribonuclease HI
VAGPKRVLIRADGAARGNPGPAAAGAVLIDASRPDAHDPDCPPLAVIARPLGRQTNNYAEYTAVILALERASEMGAGEVELVLDSKLVVEQLMGRWRVREATLVPLHATATRLLARFDSWTLRHEARASNRAADALANLALDDPSAAVRVEEVGSAKVVPGTDGGDLSWHDFAEREPDLAGAGERLLRTGVACLATLRIDGSPRLHPVPLTFSDGRLYVSADSAQREDLARDPRYALHNLLPRASEQDWHSDAFEIEGRARRITDADSARRIRFAQRAEAVHDGQLFELRLEHVQAETSSVEKPLVRRWSAHQS